MTTKIRKEQIEEIIQPQATADWTKDDVTASAKAIAAKIASSGIMKITTNYNIWELDEGVYYVDGTKRADYRGGSFTIYQNYYLFVANYNHVTPDKKRYIAFWELDNNGDDIEIYYGTCSASNGTLASKKLSQIKNMVGATAIAAGSAGFAPAPAAGDNTKFLQGNGSWTHINYVKIYHVHDEGLGVLSVDATIEEIISEYQNGYYILLEDENGHRFPLYEVVNNQLHKEVCFGVTNLYDSFTKVNTYYYIGVYQSGNETWGCYTNSGSFPGGNPFIPASVSLAGKIGLVPAPPVGSDMMVLRGDCSWANITMYLETVAVGRQQSGLYIYTLEYNSQIISYNEIQTAYQKGVPIVVKSFSPPIGFGLLWPLDIVYDSTQQRDFITFRKVSVYNNQLQCRRLKYVVENNTEYWYEIIEFKTT